MQQQIARSPIVLRLFVAWVALNVADLLLTWLGLRMGGREVGPLSAWLLVRYPFATLVAVKVLLTAALPAELALTAPLFPRRWVLGEWWLLVLLLAVVVLLDLVTLTQLFLFT